MLAIASCPTAPGPTRRPGLGRRRSAGADGQAWAIEGRRHNKTGRAWEPYQYGYVLNARSTPDLARGVGSQGRSQGAARFVPRGPPGRLKCRFRARIGLAPGTVRQPRGR